MTKKLINLKDSYHREISYLRLSVTDRCQFRCTYCMPPEGIKALPQQDYMTPEEMERLVRAMALMGVWRVRLTGGEPLLRKDIVSLVARLSSVPGIRDFSLTTNGERLPELVSGLKDAGLKRINISLDSLDPKRFREITLSDSFDRVWEGIQLSLQAGLQVKLNAVVMKGISQDEIDGFADLAFRHPIEVRFIEFMPLCGTGWKPELVVPIETVRSRIAKRYRLISRQRHNEVAQSFDLEGGKGRIGFIASMTEPFCSTCSRIRMSATGRIRLCLFSSLEYNLLPILRRGGALGGSSGGSLEEIQEEIRRATLKKPLSHPWVNDRTQAKPEENGMIRSIGG